MHTVWTLLWRTTLNQVHSWFLTGSFFYFLFYFTVLKLFQTWRPFSQIKLLLSYTHSLHHKLVLPVSLHITNYGRVWRKGAGKWGLDYVLAWMRSVIFPHKLVLTVSPHITNYDRVWRKGARKGGLGMEHVLCPDDICHLWPQHWT